MKGRMMPENEAAFDLIVEALRDQFMKLSPGQYFEGRFGLDNAGRLTEKSVVLQPPQIFPLKKAS